ncbi:hypothetical protein [Brevundimonas pondensis]|uniref:Tetratricopeptide repeat protein n=1 Tax=Brevundimonas pondensis TaxID=2774189 RepID=A0ABX7SKH7_9CAUL|nr:hypothetical protein [Brevundimonas pondensis]QTC87335.1 hypothetical protein IFE19_14745 [Brevundimonas pondensis]
MPFAALMLALIGSQTTDAGPPPAPEAVCAPAYITRVAAASYRDGATFLLQASRGGDPQTLRCIEALAVKQEADAPWIKRRGFRAARAAAAIRRNDPQNAVALLEPMVGPQHHTVSIPADFHALLSEAYEMAGRYDEAEGQRRMALAAMAQEPPFALSEDAMRGLPAREPFAGLLPISPPNPDQVFLDLSSVRIEGPVRLYDTVLLLPQDQEGAAAIRVQRRIDCQTRRGEALKILRQDASGATLEDITPEDPREDWNAVVTHRQRVICDADPGAKAGPADFVAALTLFRVRGASDRPR